MDRELYARVKTRAVQLGLTGDVLSNDETTFYTPVDAAGQPAAWERSSYWLPTRVIGQQLFSVLNATTIVEREIELTGISVNPADFDVRRDATLASEATMVRDTEVGLRYLELDQETGERVVKEDDKTRMFLLGGAFYDEAQDGPLPLGGVNWLSFDWRGTGTQADLFIAGPLILADIANPSLFGSRWDAGVDVFALAFAGEDVLYRDGVESPAENVERLRPNIDFSLGRPLGSFTKLDLRYQLSWNNFQRADDTGEDFVLPSDHLGPQRRGHRPLHPLGLPAGHRRLVEPARRMATLGAGRRQPDPGELHAVERRCRQDLAPAEVPEVRRRPRVRRRQRPSTASVSTSSASSRTSTFTATRATRCVPNARPRPTSATASSWVRSSASTWSATPPGPPTPASGLDRELLAGAGIVGTFIGPWGTVVNMDIGHALAGPDDGWSAFIAVLKLF